jgi:hypothetical protein
MLVQLLLLTALVVGDFPPVEQMIEKAIAARKAQ